MTKRIYAILAMAACFAFCPAGPAVAADFRQAPAAELDVVSPDFLLKVDAGVPGGDADADAANIVDGVCNFRIERADDDAAGFERYDLALYQDGALARVFSNRPLPMVLKRNYRGIRDGDYTITFVATDDTGKVGRGSVTLRVRH